MKPIYVAGENPVKTGNGLSIAAIRPADKGEKFSYALSNAGKTFRLDGLRINGVGVERYFKDAGYRPATADDESARVLQDQIDVRDGVKLVESASEARVEALHATFGGQMVAFVPFDAGRPVAQGEVLQHPGFKSIVLGLGTGISIHGLPVKEPALSYRSEFSLESGWVVSPEEADRQPRCTEYGGVVEMATYLIANCGLGVLRAPGNMQCEPGSGVNDPYPRGRQVLDLPDGGTLTVGIDAIDELVVVIHDAAGAEVCRRNGLEQIGSRLDLGSAVGSIAGALVKASRLAASSKPVRKAKAA